MATDLNTLILNAIKSESKYGLEIIDEIKLKSNGEIILKQPSLYSALRRLESKGYVTSYWKDSELGGKRHYYQATKLGVDALNNKRKTQSATEAYIKKALEENAEASPIQKEKNSNKENDDEYDDDEPVNENSTINYKTILGDFLTDDDENVSSQNNSFIDSDDDIEDEDVEETIEKPVTKKQTPTAVKETKQDENKSAPPTYLKEFENIFRSEPSKKEKSQQPKEYKIASKAESDEDIFANKQMALLENAAKKYNEAHGNSNTSSEKVQNELVENINKKKQISEIEIIRNERKYLLTNKMNFVSGLSILFIDIIIYSILLLLYVFKGWTSVENFIIIGACLLIVVIVVLVDIISCYKYPDKKINYKFNWSKSIGLRLLVFVLLCVASISINLLIGMESFSNMFHAKFLIRWFTPIVLSFGIIIRWIVNFILSKQDKYQSLKDDNKR